MQTIEFRANIENGMIPIPETYINIIPSRVKVIITEDIKTYKKAINFDELILDTAGFKYCREEANDW